MSTDTILLESDVLLSSDQCNVMVISDKNCKVSMSSMPEAASAYLAGVAMKIFINWPKIVCFSNFIFPAPAPKH
jgi:hypothetical protein